VEIPSVTTPDRLRDFSNEPIMSKLFSNLVAWIAVNDDELKGGEYLLPNPIVIVEINRLVKYYYRRVRTSDYPDDLI
jgi:hypothetical protein